MHFYTISQHDTCQNDKMKLLLLVEALENSKFGPKLSVSHIKICLMSFVTHGISHTLYGVYFNHDLIYDLYDSLPCVILAYMDMYIFRNTLLLFKTKYHEIQFIVATYLSYKSRV